MQTIKTTQSHDNLINSRAFIVNEPVRFTTQKKGEEVEIR